MAFEISKEHCCMLLFVCCFLLFLIWIDSPSKTAHTVRSFMGSTPPQLLGQEGFDKNQQQPPLDEQLTDEQKKNFEKLTQEQEAQQVVEEGEEVQDISHFEKEPE